jgi:hypothetical protein
VLRQFHQEGFVNQFVMAPRQQGGPIVFESEALETFELAMGDKQYVLS